VHGSAPDIAGRGIANPVGMIWAGQMMLDHFGYAEAAGTMMRAIEMALEEGGRDIVTPDLGGRGSCRKLGGYVAELIARI